MKVLPRSNAVSREFENKEPVRPIKGNSKKIQEGCHKSSSSSGHSGNRHSSPPVSKKTMVVSALLASSVGVNAHAQAQQRLVDFPVNIHLPCYNPNIFSPNPVCHNVDVLSAVLERCASAAAARGGRLNYPGPPAIIGSTRVNGGPMGIVECRYLCSLLVPPPPGTVDVLW